MIKTYINGQLVEASGNIKKKDWDTGDLIQQKTLLEEENKWLISIIKKIDEDALDNTEFRTLLAGLALPEHIKKKLNLNSSEAIKPKDKESTIRK